MSENEKKSNLQNEGGNYVHWGGGGYYVHRLKIKYTSQEEFFLFLDSVILINNEDNNYNFRTKS